VRFASLLSLLILLSPAVASAQPHAAEVIDAALKEAGLNRPLDEWSSRVRWSNAVPEIDATINLSETRDLEDHYRETLAESDESLFDFKSLQTTNAQDDQSKATLRIRVRWRPGGLVFDSHEISAERAARSRARDRQDLVARVAALYSEYIALKRRLRTSERTEEDLIRHIRVEAELDALTGGLLSRSYKEKKP